MITQRPVTGSLRSSGIECVLEDLDRRLAAAEEDRDDVEAARHAIDEIVAHQEISRDVPHAPPLERGDRLRAVAELGRLARLHLDERQRLAVAGDDVDFATPLAIAPGKN